MLDPGDRHLLTDALRPPTGFRVDAALATTYTLDLNSVLLAPLAMAAYDRADSNVDAATPIALLESIRRHASHTTVLCQAGGVRVPPSYPRLAAFAEGMVAEVMPPLGRTFHPKVWLLRFATPDDHHRHRFVCLSRNLTGDRSWDTVLVCDEDPDAGTALDAGPIVAWVNDVLGSLVRPLPAQRAEAVLGLCESFAAARLAVPEPFTAARAVPLGTDASAGWPLPGQADAWAVISPFLETSALAKLPRTRGRRLLLSRPEALDRVGFRACDGAETVVLQPTTDLSAPDESAEESGHLDERDGWRRGGVPRGLHAKVFVWDEGDTSHVLTGSANCTGAAFGGNVEMSVLLSGPKAACGVDVLIGDDKSGLLRITQPHQVVEEDGLAHPEYDLERRVEGWHASLAASQPVLYVSRVDDDFEVRLEFPLPADPHGLAATTIVKPMAVAHAPHKSLLSEASWGGVGLHGLSPYLLVSTDAELDGVQVHRACVLVCDVEGAPEDRQRQLLRDLLARQQDVLRYLMLLLGDVGADDLLDKLQQNHDPEDPGSGGAFRRGFDDLVLLEPLLRAAARGDDSLARAHRLLEDLRDEHGDLPQLDEDFQHIWRVVWEGGQS